MNPRAVIADDEPLMREQLRVRLREAWPELEIVGEARNGIEAVEKTATLQPDLVFLDIRKPADPERLRITVERIRKRLALSPSASSVHGAEPEALQALLERLRQRLEGGATPGHLK